MKARYLCILLLYAIPYVYFSAVLDAYAQGWGRLGCWLALVMLGLCCYCAYTWNGWKLVIPGNVLSFLSSFYLVTTHQDVRWEGFFKPLSTTSYTITYTLAALALQVLILYRCHLSAKNKEDEPDEA